MKLLTISIAFLTISFNLSSISCDLSYAIEHILKTLNDDDLIQGHSINKRSTYDENEVRTPTIDNQELGK